MQYFSPDSQKQHYTPCPHTYECIKEMKHFCLELMIKITLQNYKHEMSLTATFHIIAGQIGQNYVMYKSKVNDQINLIKNVSQEIKYKSEKYEILTEKHSRVNEKIYIVQ